MTAKVITPEQKDSLLKRKESFFFDFKSKSIAPSKLSKSISALANSGGGEICIGIEENNSQYIWDGFSNFEEANPIFSVLEKMGGLNGFYSYEFLECENSKGFLLLISISKSPLIVHSSDNSVYIRKNAQSLQVSTAEQLRRLELDKGITSYEDMTVDCEKEVITNSLEVMKFMLAVVPSTEPEDWLKKQKLLIDDKPTVTGLLLFADEPQIYIPKRSSIKIYRYATSDTEGERATLIGQPITIEGNLYNQIYAAVNEVKKIIENVKVIDGTEFTTIKYPDETLHEIITNAVLHRDYSLALDVHIRIFDNRVEIQSPGRLPGHVTLQNILDEQAARNPKLVRLINKFPNPPNKDVGEGLNTAFRAMEKFKLKPPEMSEEDNSLNVKIKHTPLAAPEEAVMDYLEKHGEINNSAGREITGIDSENKMKRVFYKLRKMGKIEQDPNKKGKNSSWIKKDTLANADDSEPSLFDFSESNKD